MLKNGVLMRNRTSPSLRCTTHACDTSLVTTIKVLHIEKIATTGTKLSTFNCLQYFLRVNAKHCGSVRE